MWVRGLFSLALIAAVGCGGGSSEPGACSNPVPLGTVHLEDFAFGPDCLLGASGEGIRLENVGDTPHTFTIEGTDVSFDVPAGETAEGNLSGLTPGRYAVTCIYHPQMIATLEINR